MSGRAAVADPVGNAEKYLKKLAPKRGDGDGPYEPAQPWLKELYQLGIEPLWEAVKRLEEISHNGKTSGNVGGPVIVPKTGPSPGPTKTPPPPPPAFP